MKKKILSLFLSLCIVWITAMPAFALTGNMSTWFKNSTAQTMHIISSEENLMAPDKRINPMMIIYGLFDLNGEVNGDVSSIDTPFTDISNFAPYSRENRAITWLYLKKVLEGYEDGSVRPNSNVTRAEMTAMFVRMIGKTNMAGRIPSKRTNPYGDMEGHWSYDEVLKATSIGLVQGDGYNFNPNSMITKEEVITIGLRLADFLGVDVSEYANIVDNIYHITIDYPIGNYSSEYYNSYDYVLAKGEHQNIYFDRLSNISSYEVSQTGIVTISKYTKYLKVTGKEAGRVVITANSSNGYKQSISCLVLEDETYTAKVGDTVKIYPTTRKAINTYSIISGSSYGTVSKYNNYLLIKGNKSGTMKIKITDTNGYSEIVTVKIKVSSSTDSYDYEDYYEIEKGDSEKIYSPLGNKIESYIIASGSSYVTVNQYTRYLSVKGKKVGTAKIRITDEDENIYTIKIKVLSCEDEDDEKNDYGVTESYILEKGLSKKVYFKNLDDINEYYMSKPDVISITKYSNYLKVYAEGEGSVTIKAYDSNGSSESIKITVESNSYEDYGVTKNVTIEKGAVTRINFEQLKGNLTDYDVTNSGIISIDMYNNYLKVTGKKAGTVTLKVYDSDYNSESVKITVKGNSYDDKTDYGITQNISLEDEDVIRVYFDNLSGKITDYEISDSAILFANIYDKYIKITAREAGQVILTAYDEYGNSESVKVTIESSDDLSKPPARPIIYPPGYEIDISQ